MIGGIEVPGPFLLKLLSDLGCRVFIARAAAVTKTAIVDGESVDTGLAEFFGDGSQDLRVVLHICRSSTPGPGLAAE